LRLIILAGLLVIFCQTAIAQDIPKFELAAAYTASSRVFGPTCHGGGAALTYNVRSWFGGVADVGLCGRESTTIASSTMFTYLVGPRVSYRRRLTPYAQILVGGAHESANTFAMTIGAGLDIRITDRFAIRLIQPEYLNAAREEFRIQTGVVFALGK